MPTGHIPTIKIVYDLIEVLNQRTENYRRLLLTSMKSKPELRSVFEEIIRQSTQYQQELRDSISRFDGETSLYENKRKGNVYQTWARSGFALTGDDQKSLLKSCQQELGALLKAYDQA